MKTIVDFLLIIGTAVVLCYCGLHASVLELGTSVSIRTPKDKSVDKLDYQIVYKMKAENLSIEVERERQDAMLYNNYEASGQVRFFKASWKHNEAHSQYRQELTAKVPYKKGVYSAETGLSVVWHGVKTTGQSVAYFKNQIAYKGLQAFVELYPTKSNNSYKLESIKSHISYKFEAENLAWLYFMPNLTYHKFNDVEHIQGKLEIGVKL